MPSAHRYVQHAVGGGVDVELLADPPVPGAPVGQWWPSPVLDPAWITARRAQVDVVHLHFGFEGRTPEQLGEWVDTLRRNGIPLVLTVHDLQLPHVADQTAHLARLAVLVGGASVLITLTEGAAAEIAQRFGRAAHVVDHPRMTPVAMIRAASRRPPDRIRVGVHLKSLRPNAGSARWLARVADGVRASTQPAELVVHVHEEIRDPGFVRYDADLVALLDRLAADPGVVVHWTSRMDDEQLWAYLRSIEVSVLPHRWGTHSGWLEECLDLGVVPVIPRVGYLVEQRDRHSYGWREDEPDVAQLRLALEGAIDEAAAGRTEEEAWSWAQRRDSAAHRSQQTHRRLYLQAIEAVAAR